MKVGGYSGSLTRFSSLLPKKVHWVKKIDNYLQWFGFFVSFWGGLGWACTLLFLFFWTKVIAILFWEFEANLSTSNASAKSLFRRTFMFLFCAVSHCLLFPRKERIGIIWNLPFKICWSQGWVVSHMCFDESIWESWI